MLVGLGALREEADAILADVRRRDRERLEAQAEGGLYAGMEPFRVQPEPLTRRPPRRRRSGWKRSRGELVAAAHRPLTVAARFPPALPSSCLTILQSYLRAALGSKHTKPFRNGLGRLRRSP